MKAILRILPFILLAFLVGCDEVPTDREAGATEAEFAKGGNGGNKPPPDEEPPGNWSSDQEIVYISTVTKKGNHQRRIVVASVVENADGTVGSADAAIVLSGEAEIFNPAWSASGEAVLFEVPFGLEGRGVYAVRMDPVTNGASAPELLFPVGAGGMPAMSPDGSKIAYVDWSGEPGDIWVRERAPDGSWGSPINIDANGPVVGFAPAWASDSRRLVATKDQDLVVYDIDPDGNGIIDEISEMSITAGGPLEGQIVGGESSWARSDDRVVFSNFGIWIIDFNDPENVATCQLVDNGVTWDVDYGSPRWSPDDTRIVYGGYPDNDIRIMTLDSASSQANGCPVIVSDDVFSSNSPRCTGSRCETVQEQSWRRF